MSSPNGSNAAGNLVDLHLVGLTDDYTSDGTVITAALTHPSAALTSTRLLAAVYTQLNSSVGTFATDTLLADSHALSSGSSTSDSTFTREQAALGRLVDDRDRLVNSIKQTLAGAAAGHQPVPGPTISETARAAALLLRRPRYGSLHRKNRSRHHCGNRRPRASQRGSWAPGHQRLVH